MYVAAPLRYAVNERIESPKRFREARPRRDATHFQRDLMSSQPANSNEHLLLSIAQGTEIAADETVEFDAEQMIAHVLSDPGVVQHVTRTRADGVETIAGYFRCPFKADQERSILHVPIVPALTEIPEVEALVMEDDAASAGNARIRITDRQKFGLRLEVIRSGGKLPATDLMVEVTCTAADLETN